MRLKKGKWYYFSIIFFLSLWFVHYYEKLFMINFSSSKAVILRSSIGRSNTNDCFRLNKSYFVRWKTKLLGKILVWNCTCLLSDKNLKRAKFNFLSLKGAKFIFVHLSEQNTLLVMSNIVKMYL